MTVAGALLAFGVIFVVVSALSEKFTPLIGIGFILVAVWVAKIFVT